MRLIDADALIDAISVHLERIEQELEDTPTIDAIRHGHWIEEPYTESLVTKRCSECMKVAVITSEGIKVGDYCPHCGAKMDGGEE